MSAEVFEMEVLSEEEMFADHRVLEESVPEGYGMMSGENPSGVITFPNVLGGVVTRMTVNPISGVISSINIETSESSVSFPKEVRFELNAEINIQKIIIIGGSGQDIQ